MQCECLFGDYDRYASQAKGREFDPRLPLQTEGVLAEMLVFRGFFQLSIVRAFSNLRLRIVEVVPLWVQLPSHRIGRCCVFGPRDENF